METHQKYMHKCLQLAKKALTKGNPPVGAILVVKNKIIGEGIEAGKSSGDLTNHAEILSIRNAIKNGHLKELHKAIMYTTHEPCIMCSYLIRHHRIPHIIFGTSIDYIGGYTSKFKILNTIEVPKWGNKPKITEGVCKSKCEELTEEFHQLLNKLN
ncbi:MAG: nucleoside deaminase [Chlorobi bacterium]|nr:nucleoside deaminase [Chlorobiota bacterium]